MQRQNEVFTYGFQMFVVQDYGQGNSTKASTRARIRKLFVKILKHQTFCVKSRKVNILGFVGHMVSAGTTQLCPCSVEAPTDNIYTMRVAAFPQHFIDKNRQWTDLAHGP